MSLLAAKLAEAQAATDIPFELLGRTAAELLAEAPEQPDWLIPGVAARGWLVKVAAREKTGKGTMIFYLLGCLERHEPTVFGDAATAAVTSLIYTEEPLDSVREKVVNAGLTSARIIQGWELTNLPNWHAKVDYLVRVAETEGHGVLFVDNVSRASGCEDEAGTELGRAAEYLGEKARAVGVTGLVDHHHRKAAGRLDDKSRGGTALAGACDNNIEMERVGSWDSRVRKVSSRGRMSATIWERQIALSDDGTTYDSVADDGEPQTVEERKRLRVLRDAGEAGVTVAEFQAATEGSKTTAGRVLNEFVETGRATVDGKPKRYRAVEQTTTRPPI